MTHTDSPKLLPAITLNPDKAPIATVIWLHGLGANGHDFVNIVPELKLPENLPVRFIFPHAPIRPITINDGMEMPAWYDIEQLDFQTDEDEKGIGESANAINQLIDQEKRSGIPYDHIFLAGFSQGGAITLHAGLRYPEKLGGLIVLSSYLPLAKKLKNEAHKANQTTPIFMAHGEIDELIPISVAERSRDFLQSHGYTIDWHSYSTLQHSVNLEEAKDIGEWLNKKML